MKPSAQLIKHAVILCLSLFLAGVILSDALAQQNPGDLQSEDCAKCHVVQGKILERGGGRHRLGGGCLECHPQHPPESQKVVVACQLCHTGTAHDEVADCLHCHVDPHQPLASLREPRKPVRSECLSCHGQIEAEMTDSPSLHAKLSCNFCHEQHGESPVCLDCHDAHMPHQEATDCTHCHGVHDPTNISAKSFVPGSFCLPCHQEQAQELSETTTNHGDLSCAYCHAGPHPTTADCKDCHGVPHASSIHGRHRRCQECHQGAHQLINR